MANVQLAVMDDCLRPFLKAPPGGAEEYEWLRLARVHICPHIEAVLKRKFGVFVKIYDDPSSSGGGRLVSSDLDDAHSVALDVLICVRHAIDKCKRDPDNAPIHNLAGLTRQRTNHKFAEHMVRKRPEFFRAREDMVLLARKRHKSLFAIWNNDDPTRLKAFGLLSWRFIGASVNKANWDQFFSSTLTAVAEMLRCNRAELEKSGVEETSQWVRGSAWHFYLLMTWIGDKVPLNETAKRLAVLSAYADPPGKASEPSRRQKQASPERYAAQWAFIKTLTLEYRRAYLLSRSKDELCPLNLFLQAGILDQKQAAIAVEMPVDFIAELPAFLKNREIAGYFGIRESSVAVYRHRVRKRLGEL